MEFCYLIIRDRSSATDHLSQIFSFCISICSKSCTICYFVFDVSHRLFIFVVGIRNWKSEFTILSGLHMKQGRILPYHRLLLVHLYSVYNSILNFMSGFNVFYCRTGDPLLRLYITLVRYYYQTIVVRGPRSPISQSEPQFLINITNSYHSQHNYSVFTIVT